MSKPKSPQVVKYLSRIGSIGGRSKSEAKVKAAQQNGKLGGRPKTISQDLPSALTVNER